MLQTPNSRTARASVVRMASSLWIWHTIMKNPCAPNKYIKYKVYHFAAPVCNICIGRPVYVPQGSQLIFSQPASVLIGEAQP